MPATRRLDTSVVAKSGWSNIIRYWVGTPWQTVTRSLPINASAPAAVHGVGTMIGGDHVLQLVPDPGHRTHVGERQRREAPIARCAERSRAERHRAQAGVVEPRTLGHPGGATGPDDGHRIGGVERRRAAATDRRPGDGVRQFAVEHVDGRS